MSSALRYHSRQCLCTAFLRFSSASPISAYATQRHSLAVPFHSYPGISSALQCESYQRCSSAYHSQSFRSSSGADITYQFQSFAVLFVAARFHCCLSKPRLYYAIPRLCLPCVATRFHCKSWLFCSDARHYPTIQLYSCAFIAYRCPCQATQTNAMPKHLLAALFQCTSIQSIAIAYRFNPLLFHGAISVLILTVPFRVFALPLLFQAVQFISLSLQRAASPMPGKSLLFLCHSARSLAFAKLCFSCAILCQTMPVASLNMSCLFSAYPCCTSPLLLTATPCSSLRIGALASLLFAFSRLTKRNLAVPWHNRVVPIYSFAMRS